MLLLRLAPVKLAPSRLASSTFAFFKVTGAVTDASGYTKVPVTHVASNGTFSNSDGITVQFSYSGADAATGDPTALAIALGG